MFSGAGGLDHNLLTLDLYLTVKSATFPFLQIAHQTVPGTMTRGLEHELVVAGLGRLQQEHLDEGTRRRSVGIRLAEMHTGLDNLGVVHHHEGTLRQILGQIEEMVFTHHTFIIYK